MPTTRPTIVATAVNTLEPAAAWNSQVLDKARYEQEVLAGTNTDKIAAAAVFENNGIWYGDNIMDNGGMEIWQRGTGPVDANPVSQCLADGWRLDYGTWQRVTGETGFALQCAASATPAPPFMSQVVQEWQQYKGQTIAVLVRAGMDTGKGLVIAVDDGVAAFNALNNSTSSSYQTFTCAGTVSASATQLVIYVGSAFDTTCTLSIDSVMVVVGGVPSRYAPDPMAVQWARVRRRYGSVKVTRLWYETIATTQEFAVRWPCELPSAPLASIALTGTPGTDYGGGVAPVLANVDALGCTLSVPATVIGGYAFLRNQRVIYDMGVY